VGLSGDELSTVTVGWLYGVLRAVRLLRPPQGAAGRVAWLLRAWGANLGKHYVLILGMPATRPEGAKAGRVPEDKDT
jgi:hypothetical protein